MHLPGTRRANPYLLTKIHYAYNDQHLATYSIPKRFQADAQLGCSCSPNLIIFKLSYVSPTYPGFLASHTLDQRSCLTFTPLLLCLSTLI